MDGDNPFCFTFSYHDGGVLHTAHADPQETHRALIRESGGALGQILKNARSDDIAIAFPAIENLLLIARAVFRLPALDRDSGTGVLERDVNRVLGEWWQFTGAIKKKPASSPTGSAPTEPASSAVAA